MTTVGGGSFHHERDCPECRAKKHGNCTGWALDDDENMVPCECQQGGHA